MITDQALNDKTVYLRWIKLSNLTYRDPMDIPLAPDLKPYQNRLIIVPDESINTLVDMGIVRQPRVALKDEPDADGNLVDNLFAVEGIPPGAVFLVPGTVANRQRENGKISSAKNIT